MRFHCCDPFCLGRALFHGSELRERLLCLSFLRKPEFSLSFRWDSFSLFFFNYKERVAFNEMKELGGIFPHSCFESKMKVTDYVV